MSKVLDKPMTFAQLFCLIISILCIVFGTYAFGVIMHDTEALKDATVTSLVTVIIAGMFAAFAACYKFITGSTASSQAKDDAQAANTAKLTDSAINSVPISTLPTVK